MTPRIEQEIKLIRKYYSNSRYKEHGNGWVILLDMLFPKKGIWSVDYSDICFCIPNGYPGQPPYGFYVKGGLRVKCNNVLPGSYTETNETPFDGIWGKLSWQIDGIWKPSSDVHRGSNLISFIRSFNDRLVEAN